VPPAAASPPGANPVSSPTLTGPSSPESMPPARPKRRSRLWVAVVLVVAVAVVGAGLYAYVEWPASSAYCPATKPPSGTKVLYVLQDCETSTAMPADSFRAFLLVPISDHMTVLGQYSANGTLGSYVVNSTEISVIESNPHPSGPPNAYYWTGGVSAAGNFSIQIPPAPGQYYLVLENLNPQALSVLWTATLQVVDLG